MRLPSSPPPVPAWAAPQFEFHAVAPHAPYTVSDATWARVKAMAEELQKDEAKEDTPEKAPSKSAELLGFLHFRFEIRENAMLRGVHDRQAVLAAFEAQDDVLGRPDDWEASLGCDFIVENYDNGDSTYVLVKPGAFDETSATNAKDGKWWPYSVVVLLP